MPSYRQHTTLTDEELLTAYRRDGDNQWLGFLLQRYTALLLGVAYKYLGERSAAEDAVQHVFETTLTHLPQEPILNFKGWLYVLMRNHCLQQLRNRPFLQGEEAFAHSPQDDAMENLLQLEHSLDQLAACLQLLGAEQRTTITMFYLEKKTYEQIMSATGFTFMQVKSYIQNGKRNLKHIIEKKMREAL